MHLPPYIKQQVDQLWRGDATLSFTDAPTDGLSMFAPLYMMVGLVSCSQRCSSATG